MRGGGHIAQRFLVVHLIKVFPGPWRIAVNKPGDVLIAFAQAMVVEGEVPDIDARLLAQTTQSVIGFKVEIAVVPRTRALQLAHLAAFNVELPGNSSQLGDVQALFRLVSFTAKQGEGRGLHIKIAAVVVVPVIFFETVLAGGHPLVILAKPLL